MTLHRIDQAVVIDTDDIPGRGGYAVVGISSRVTPAERSFVASNFGISDYLHDPKTENRLFYSSFRIHGGRHAFVRRFARGNELRRNDTQRRLVVHTLLLDDALWEKLFALPWLLLNAHLYVEGSKERNYLRPEVPAVDEGSVLPALEWDDEDGSMARAWKDIERYRTFLASQFEGRDVSDLLARVITALSSSRAVTLPQNNVYELLTMLAWSMLPRHDRDELAWTQHDSMNLSGITFALANVPGAAFDPAQIAPATWATELVRMNVESENSWLDLQGRTARHPLTVRNPLDLEKWINWRNALLNLRAEIGKPDAQVVASMTRLANTVAANPTAAWIDGEEILRLIWSETIVTGGQTSENAINNWSRQLRMSGLGDIIFRSAPTKRWLSAAAAVEGVGANPLVSFFLAGGGEDAESAPMRTALAEWIVEAKTAVDGEKLALLAYLLAVHGSRALQPLLEHSLSTEDGLAAMTKYLERRSGGNIDLMHAAAPVVLRRNHPNTAKFFREVFVARFDANRVDAPLAREIANVIGNDSKSFLAFLRRVSPNVARELVSVVRQSVADPKSRALARDVLAHFKASDGGLENALPLAIALAQAGEKGEVWFDVLLRTARSIDAQGDSSGSRDFAQIVRALPAKPLNLDGGMEQFLALASRDRVVAHDALRAVIMLLRPVWAKGGSAFVNAVAGMIERARLVTTWEDVVAAYADDHGSRSRDDVSNLAAAFWCKIDPSQVEMLSQPTVALLDRISGAGLVKLASHWAPKVGLLPRSSAVVEKLLALVQTNSNSYEVERDLAIREIELRVATPRTLNRLEAALWRIHASNPQKATQAFAREATRYLGDDSAERVLRLLRLFASDEIHPTVRLALKTAVLPDVLKHAKRRHWDDVRSSARREDLLGTGVVMRVAYAVGAHAGSETARHFEQIWSEQNRTDAIAALREGRARRGLGQWFARLTGTAAPSVWGE